jgi:hypothetical protein
MVVRFAVARRLGKPKPASPYRLAPATLIRASPDKSAIEPYLNQKIVTVGGKNNLPRKTYKSTKNLKLNTWLKPHCFVNFVSFSDLSLIAPSATWEASGLKEEMKERIHCYKSGLRWAS